MGKARETVAQGWAFPLRSRKWHYFVEGRSLCGRWLFLGGIYASGQKENACRDDDCRGCEKKLAKVG